MGAGLSCNRQGLSSYILPLQGSGISLESQGTIVLWRLEHKSILGSPSQVPHIFSAFSHLCVPIRSQPYSPPRIANHPRRPDTSSGNLARNNGRIVSLFFFELMFVLVNSRKGKSVPKPVRRCSPL
jgi:hypothetical protein